MALSRPISLLALMGDQRCDEGYQGKCCDDNECRYYQQEARYVLNIP